MDCLPLVQAFWLRIRQLVVSSCRPVESVLCTGLADLGKLLASCSSVMVMPRGVFLGVWFPHQGCVEAIGVSKPVSTWSKGKTYSGCCRWFCVGIGIVFYLDDNGRGIRNQSLIYRDKMLRFMKASRLSNLLTRIRTWLTIYYAWDDASFMVSVS